MIEEISDDWMMLSLFPDQVDSFLALSFEVSDSSLVLSFEVIDSAEELFSLKNAHDSNVHVLNFHKKNLCGIHHKSDLDLLLNSSFSCDEPIRLV